MVPGKPFITQASTRRCRPRFERRGRYDTAEVVPEELVFDGPPLVGEVAGPVGHHGVGQFVGETANDIGTSSVPLRDRQKVIVRCPDSTSALVTEAHSELSA